MLLIYYFTISIISRTSPPTFTRFVLDQPKFDLLVPISADSDRLLESARAIKEYWLGALKSFPSARNEVAALKGTRLITVAKIRAAKQSFRKKGGGDICKGNSIHVGVSPCIFERITRYNYKGNHSME